MTSIWHQTVQIAPRPALEQDLTVDAAVIGAGLTGVLTGYFLAGQGLKTVILERGRIGCGQTGRTTAKITSQQGLIYQTLIRRFGTGTAKKFAQSQQEAVALYQQLIQRLHIDCDFEPASAYLYGSGNAALLKARPRRPLRWGCRRRFAGLSAASAV
jgi:glycine/D-amino acid oxidase-like deaminating enzyme